jgi:hypothetical protein
VQRSEGDEAGAAERKRCSRLEGPVHRRGHLRSGAGIRYASLFLKPCLADVLPPADGLIHSRWTLVEGGEFKNVRDPSEPLVILGDVVQLREALFASFPERKVELEQRRRAFRQVPFLYRLLFMPVRYSSSALQETIRLYDSASHSSLPSIIDRLSHIILYDPTSVSIRIRRGIAFYRLRLLTEALRDLTKAVELSTTSVEGVPDQHEPDVDALRMRALVLEEMQCVLPCLSLPVIFRLPSLLRSLNEAATRDVDAVLAQEPFDVLCLSLRAILLGNKGDTNGAESVLKTTNSAVRKGKV